MREFVALMDRHMAHVERTDYHTGLICALLANIHRDPTQHEPFTPADFMPSMAPPAGAPQEAEALDSLLALGASLGAEVIVHE